MFSCEGWYKVADCEHYEPKEFAPGKEADDDDVAITTWAHAATDAVCVFYLHTTIHDVTASMFFHFSNLLHRNSYLYIMTEVLLLFLH